MRLRRNCSDDDMYFLQAAMLRERFIEKGYDTSSVDMELRQVALIERDSLLQDKEPRPNDDSYKFSMLTSYSNQHRDVQNIINKHWDILKSDKVLGPSLPEQAKVIFRGAPTLRNSIAPNVVDPPERPVFFQDMKGYYPCKKCRVCQFNTNGRTKSLEFGSTSTGRQYPIKVFCTCATTHVVYLVTCPCGKQYVGRTIRAFSVRVGEHVTKIIGGSTKHTVPRHYRECHARNPKGSQFLIIDKYVAPWRGGAKTRGVSRLEAYWIYELRTYVPYGLNVDWDINAFINQS